MAEFYIELNAQDNGNHLIHKSDCSLLPAKEAIYYLGSISSINSAAKKASERFARPTGCSHCSPT